MIAQAHCDTSNGLSAALVRPVVSQQDQSAKMAVAPCRGRLHAVSLSLVHFLGVGLVCGDLDAHQLKLVSH